MFKKALAGLLGSFFTVTCLASPSIFHKFSAPKKNKPQITQKAPGSYMDFTGTWTGVCVYNDETSESTITIANDEESISMDGERFIIGALMNKSSSHAFGVNIEMIRFNWNQDSTRLMIRGNYIDVESGKMPMFTSMFKGSMALTNEKLVIQMTSLGFIDLDKFNRASMTCSYDKAANHGNQ